MDELLRLPVRAYEWVYGNYGFVGVTMTVLMVVLTIMTVSIWLDRRR